MRLIRIQGADLNIFDFDYDLTWTAFFMNADNKVYGRYGGRDAHDADARNSLEGLHHAMQAAITAHRLEPVGQPAPPARAPLYVERLPAAKNYRGCIHCHQVAEILRAEKKAAGTWKREDLWVHPLPENVGLTLTNGKEDVVHAVTAQSSAARAGLQANDLLRAVNGLTVASEADLRYALHRAPLQGEITVSWLREQRPMSGKLALTSGWRKTNITWRPSTLDLLPALTVFGPDLTAKEKQGLGLDAKRLAFRQGNPVHSAAQAMGVQENDVIIGIDNPKLEMSVGAFLAHVRQNYLIGDQATLHILRDGKQLDLKVKLK